jgi:DNA polymerase III epsilon subunit-like protein
MEKQEKLSQPETDFWGKIEEIDEISSQLGGLKIEVSGDTKSRGKCISDPTPFEFHSGHTMEEIETLRTLLPSDKIYFLDTETTGIGKKDRIVEIAIICRDYSTMTETRYYSLINPEGTKSCKEAYLAHKIDHRILTAAKRFSEVWDSGIATFLQCAHHPEGEEDKKVPSTQKEITQERVIVAHNASFDYRMVCQELERLGPSPVLPKDEWHCSYQIARKLYGQGKGLNSLDRLCERFNVNKDARNECHSAMVDVLLLADVYTCLLLERHKNSIHLKTSEH